MWGEDYKQVPLYQMKCQHVALVITDLWQELSIWLFVEDLAKHIDKVITQEVEVPQRILKDVTWLVGIVIMRSQFVNFF